MPFKFEKLEVWKEAIQLSGLVHKITKSFPTEERQILTPQIMRAVDSIALNIAEGSTGQSSKEFKRFLNYAVRSGLEVISCIFLAKERNIISENDFKRIYQTTDTLIMRIQALKKALK